MLRWTGVVVVIVILASLFAVPAQGISPEAAVKLVSEQQSQNPIIGVWHGAANGYSWQLAIIRNADPKEHADYVGVMLQPWPFFKRGETCLRLTANTDGSYGGEQKWKTNALYGTWHPARVEMQDVNHVVQHNQVRFPSAIGTVWAMDRHSITTHATEKGLQQAGNSSPNTAVIAPSGDAVTGVVFFWFDERPPVPGTEVIEIVVTARAYEAVLNILREVRGANTQVQGGFSVLETNYHPPTFQLGQWVESHPDPKSIGSVLYWDDEQLGETTPVMTFHMTRRAYQSTTEIIAQYLGRPEQTQRLTEPQRNRRRSFLSALAVVAQGALQGMANYYAVVRPAEQAALAAQQANSAQTYAASQQVYELQSLNQKLDRASSQAFMDRLSRQQAEYGRLLNRYTAGKW